MLMIRDDVFKSIWHTEVISKGNFLPLSLPYFVYSFKQKNYVNKIQKIQKSVNYKN